MKTIIAAYAKYNAAVNGDLRALLERLPEEKLARRFTGFYPTIFDTLYHILLSNIVWIKRFAPSRPDAAGFLKYTDALLREELAGRHDALFKMIGEVDALLNGFIDGLSDDDLGKVVSYKNYKGEQTEKELWKILLQMFNHHTHHRGQVSELLDMMGVENDYSSLLPRI